MSKYLNDGEEKRKNSSTKNFNINMKKTSKLKKNTSNKF